MLKQIRPLPVETSRLSLGPRDHGRVLALDEYYDAAYEEGYTYEIIDGVLVVSPNPLPNHDRWVNAVHEALLMYTKRFPRRLNYVSTRSELSIPRRPGPTRPQPDIAAYRDFPDPPPASWDEVCPVIVVEVISPRRAAKDTDRNRFLYLEKHQVAEYWIIDPSVNALEPRLIALRRKPRAAAWEEQSVPFGRTYTCKALPGLKINLKPAKPK